MRAKKTSVAQKSRNRVIGAFLAVCIALILIIAVAVATAEDKKVISVCKLKDNVSANALITSDMLEEYQMYYKEFANSGITTFTDGSKVQSIVTWDKRNDVIGKRYAAYYLRAQTPLYWDSTVKEQTKRNSYLYNMNGELLNIQMDTTTDFGDMVVPGDTLNIRVNYDKKYYNLSDIEKYKLGIDSGAGNSTEGVSVKTTEMLFNEVSVLDMLNGDGNSIFDIYYDYVSLSKAAQNEKLKDSTFLESIKPQSILLEVTAEEADRFMELKSSNPTYQITLLPRTGSNAILDSLSDIQKALSGGVK